MLSRFNEDRHLQHPMPGSAKRGFGKRSGRLATSSPRLMANVQPCTQPALAEAGGWRDETRGCAIGAAGVVRFGLWKTQDRLGGPCLEADSGTHGRFSGCRFGDICACSGATRARSRAVARGRRPDPTRSAPAQRHPDPGCRYPAGLDARSSRQQAGHRAAAAVRADDQGRRLPAAHRPRRPRHRASGYNRRSR